MFDLISSLLYNVKNLLGAFDMSIKLVASDLDGTIISEIIL